MLQYNVMQQECEKQWLSKARNLQALLSITTALVSEAVNLYSYFSHKRKVSGRKFTAIICADGVRLFHVPV